MAETLQTARPPAGHAGRMRGEGWLGLLAAVALCEGIGVLGAVITDTGKSTWYRSLRKPSFTPPPAVFGPVWTVLYLLMGVSLHQLWRERRSPAGRRAVQAFGVQLLLNALWTPVFFGLKSIGGGLAVIVALWGAVLATLKRAWEVSRPAGWLLVPYFLWVSFATMLNAALLARNRGFLQTSSRRQEFVRNAYAP